MLGRVCVSDRDEDRRPRRDETDRAAAIDAEPAPTILDLAGGDAPDDLDGSSISLLLTGTGEPDRIVYGEYLGEGAIAPLLMVRRGSLKYIRCSTDPPQLFDLALDPDELVNVATDSRYADELSELHVLLEARWDSGAIHRGVLDSQRRRRLVDRSLRKGKVFPWEYEAPRSGADSYMRNHLDLNDLEQRRRYPC